MCTTSRRVGVVKETKGKVKMSVNKNVFHMPDGSILTSCAAVDRYYGLGGSCTSRRLKVGWTPQECAMNYKTRGNQPTRIFHMPDGTTLYKCADVDRYYNLYPCTTHHRLTERGWSIEECTNNCKKQEIKYTFKMPNGTVLHMPIDVDRYYNLVLGTTHTRLNNGWTIVECANNTPPYRKKRVFQMPDGTVLTQAKDVDIYYGLRQGTTTYRLNQCGWTEQECAYNFKQKGSPKAVPQRGARGRQEKRVRRVHVFQLPNGTVTQVCYDVDRFYNLKLGTTSSRLEKGWTVAECAYNKRQERPKKVGKYRFPMPDGRVFTMASEVDSYYGLGSSTTASRIKRGWTELECAHNRRL